ncbi:hypothetical protein CsSME_00051478 [Camellia sinensis var. sinensis]
MEEQCNKSKFFPCGEYLCLRRENKVFDAISQLEFSSEVWELVFFVTSKVVEKFNDGALATIIGFLFKAASHCRHISEAVRTSNN